MNLLLFLAMMAVPADTTDFTYDPFTAPLQSDLTPGTDVMHVRAALVLLPAQRAIRGTASYFVQRSDSTFVLRVGAASVEGVRVFEDSASWQVSGDTLRIHIPNDAGQEVIVHVDYATERVGYDIRGRAGWTAVWTPSRADESHWIPPPLAWADAFSVDISMSVPPSWDVRFPTGTHVPVKGPDFTTHVWQPEGERLAHGLGFLAAEPGLLVQRDSLVWSLSDEVERPDSIVGVPSILLPAGYPSHYWNGLHLLSDETVLEKTPVLRVFQQNLFLARAELGALQTSAYLTDGWLSESLPAFLASERLRSTHGDGAWAQLMETARDRYLRETESYSRPLVWDRWNAPLDLEDAHALWKGLWIVHMLAEATSVPAVTAAILDLNVAAEHAPVDTETFREQLEAVSGDRLSGFFDTWVYGAGHPIMTVIYSHQPDSERLTMILQQEQDGAFMPEVFPFSAALTVSTIAGLDVYPIDMTSREVRRTVDAPLRPRYVYLDDAMSVLFEWSSPPDPDDVTARLRDATDVVTKVQLLSVLTDGEPDSGLLIGLRSVITDAPAPVLETALPVLAAMAPSASALRIIMGMPTSDPGVGRARLTALAAFPGDEAATQALATANNNQNGFLLEEAVRILVARRQGLSWSVLQSALVTDSDEDRIRRQAIQLVETSDRSARERLAALLPLTEGPNRPVTRGEALLAAARVAPTDWTVRRRTAAWLPDERPALRAAAIAALALLPDDAVSSAALEGALKAETRPALRRALQAYMSDR